MSIYWEKGGRKSFPSGENIAADRAQRCGFLQEPGAVPGAVDGAEQNWGWEARSRPWQR